MLYVMRDVRVDVPICQIVNLKSCLGIHRNVRCDFCHHIIFPDVVSPAGD